MTVIYYLCNLLNFLSVLGTQLFGWYLWYSWCNCWEFGTWLSMSCCLVAGHRNLCPGPENILRTSLEKVKKEEERKFCCTPQSLFYRSTDFLTSASCEGCFLKMAGPCQAEMGAWQKIVSLDTWEPLGITDGQVERQTDLFAAIFKLFCFFPNFPRIVQTFLLTHHIKKQYFFDIYFYANIPRTKD